MFGKRGIEAAAEAPRVPFPRIRDGTSWVRPEADYAAAHETLRPQFGSERLYHGTSANVQGPLRPTKREAARAQWTDLYTGMRGDTSRPWRGHVWTTSNRETAREYGPNVREMQGDVSGAPTIRTEADLRQLLGPRSDELMAQRRGDVWQHLDDPAVREELRKRGVGAVHISDDMAPNNLDAPQSYNWHDSYLILNENRVRPPRPQHNPMQGGTPEALARLRAQGFDVPALPVTVTALGRPRGATGMARYRYAPEGAPRGTEWNFVVEPDAASKDGLFAVQMQLRHNGQPVPVEQALGSASPEEAFAIYRALQETLTADAIAYNRPGYYMSGSGRLRDLHEQFAARAERLGMLPPGYRYAPRERNASARIVRDDLTSLQLPRPQHDQMQGGTPEARERLRAQGFVGLTALPATGLLTVAQRRRERA